MNWERLSLLLALVFAPAIYTTLHLAHVPTWPLAAQLLLQAVFALVVITLIAHGANWLVDAACRIAHRLGMSHLVIGLTVVAFGTSAPEIAASLAAGFAGSGDLAVANVVGSNVFNLCFILGGVAVLMRQGLPTDRSLVYRDGPMLLAGTALLFLFVGKLPGSAVEPGPPSWLPVLLNRRLERTEGIVLVSMLVGYLSVLYRSRAARGAGQGARIVDEVIDAHRDLGDGDEFGEFTPRDIPIFLAGLVTVIGGCDLLVGQAAPVAAQGVGYGALWFAQVFEIPEYVVGLTIVAAGTSAPELVVSMVAALRGAHGLSAGNLIGSDIFNFYGVIGLSGLLLQSPLAPPVVVTPGLVVGVAAPMVIVVVVIAFMRTGMRIGRSEGVALLCIGAARWAYDLSAG